MFTIDVIMHFEFMSSSFQRKRYTIKFLTTYKMSMNTEKIYLKTI